MKRESPTTVNQLPGSGANMSLFVVPPCAGILFSNKRHTNLMYVFVSVSVVNY
jgi:hypothetical protein